MLFTPPSQGLTVGGKGEGLAEGGKDQVELQTPVNILTCNSRASEPGMGRKPGIRERGSGQQLCPTK
jgi:hypothetical protein